MPDLVFACVYLVLDLVHLTNCVALPGKFCSNAFKFQLMFYDFALTLLDTEAKTGVCWPRSEDRNITTSFKKCGSRMVSEIAASKMRLLISGIAGDT